MHIRPLSPRPLLSLIEGPQGGLLGEVVASIRVVMAFGLEKAMLRSYQDTLKSQVHNSLTASFLRMCYCLRC